MMKQVCILALVLLATSCASASRRDARTRVDLLIVNGRIVDGTGSPWYRGDVAIRGDRIVGVGRLRGVQARDTIDANGLIVSPGWIDMLGHSEYPLLTDGRALSKITQGITTEITGEVTSVVPVNERTLRELGFARNNRVDWNDLDGYFARLARAQPAINLATYVTVGSVRRYVMGDANRPATPAELAQMRELVAHAMQQGAVGLSSGMIYAPATFASTAEIVELARIAAAYGGGYASHIRSEGARLVEAVNEAITIGEQAGSWVQIHHLKASGKANWGKMPAAVAAIEGARARGVDVSADQYPYRASSTGLDAIIPSWAHAGGNDSLIARLQDSETRKRLTEEIMGPDQREELIGESSGGPGGVMLAGFRTDSLRKYNGMLLSDVALQRNQPAIDAVFDLLIADSAATQAIYFSMSEEDIEYAMKQPWVSIGIDAGARDTILTSHPHPRAYGSFPRILCHYVRQRNVLTLPDAIRKFSALAAARVGLADRGVIKAGMYADLTIFDEATVCDRATFEKPLQTSVGIQHVLVNGVAVVRAGKVTGARPGRGLRRNEAAASPVNP
ncbi:MAG TPA: D-aminoacylase [Longimicrobiales bacterium]|nr:D-aminoacylase [Longimicrobiales bacterium]